MGVKSVEPCGPYDGKGTHMSSSGNSGWAESVGPLLNNSLLSWLLLFF